VNEVAPDFQREVAANRPGGASCGLVAPMVLRADWTALVPSSAMTTTGADVM
jgi:hypothetical protein